VDDTTKIYSIKKDKEIDGIDNITKAYLIAKHMENKAEVREIDDETAQLIIYPEKKKKKESYPLSRVLKCSLCGSYFSSYSVKGKRYYRCQGYTKKKKCISKTIDAGKIENYVYEFMMQFFHEMGRPMLDILLEKIIIDKIKYFTDWLKRDFIDKKDVALKDKYIKAKHITTFLKSDIDYLGHYLDDPEKFKTTVEIKDFVKYITDDDLHQFYKDYLNITFNLEDDTYNFTLKNMEKYNISGSIYDKYKY